MTSDGEARKLCVVDLVYRSFVSLLVAIGCAPGPYGLQETLLVVSAMRQHLRLEIEYCTQCHWLLRAAWMAQELLTTFEKELGEVALVPGRGGIFEVRLEGETIFSRQQQGRFPEAKELKQLVRDRIAPDRDLGHSDRR